MKPLVILFAVLVSVVTPGIALSQCTIRTTPVSFGNYDVFSNVSTDSIGAITVACSSDVVKANVTLGPSSTSGTFNPRKMKHSGGKDQLNYNIFVDPGRTTILGNGSGGTTDIRLKRPTGKPQPWSENISIYGRIPPGQDVYAGSYSDILTATIDW
jgi:spore coat protein U-like protein